MIRKVTDFSVIRLFGDSVIRKVTDFSVIRLFGDSVIRATRKGFTLVELLVVIGIIGILSGVLIASLSGGTDSARTARCLSNMRNLAAACQTYGQEHGRYPHAGSIEYMKINESRGRARAQATYHEEPGWISWNSKGAYEGGATSPKGGQSWMASTYSDDEEAMLHCLTNGALWKYVSGNRQTYVCPVHAKTKGSTPPNWSYLMNAYFGWYASGNPEAEHFDRIDYGYLQKADKVLLFSEIPFAGIGSWQPDTTGAGIDCDCVLQFDVNVETKTGSKGSNASNADGKETIGFNHKSGKMTFANVVFADGHVEKLRLPKGGLSDGELQNLTAWLCTGTDVSFDGKRYQKVDN